MRFTWLGITSVLLMQLFLLMLFSLLPGMPWDFQASTPCIWAACCLMCALAADKSHQCLRQHLRFRQHHIVTCLKDARGAPNRSAYNRLLSAERLVMPAAR